MKKAKPTPPQWHITTYTPQEERRMREMMQIAANWGKSHPASVSTRVISNYGAYIVNTIHHTPLTMK